ncbi:hypothetical protein GCM10020367_68500 [Streptomyces sannanensis]|uniref:Transposase n=1 Tax=Streptomyces sannanensis TaxID=285536 RepID=A0ABP6SN62_9ACTN
MRDSPVAGAGMAAKAGIWMAEQAVGPGSTNNVRQRRHQPSADRVTATSASPVHVLRKVLGTL